MKISPVVKSEQFHYVAARCENRKGETVLTLFFSEDLKPKSVEHFAAKKEIKELKSGKEIAPAFKTNPKEPSPRAVGKASLIQKNEKNQTPLQWTLYSAQTQKNTEARFNLSANLGFSFFNYLEPSQGLHLNGLNFTPKINASYAIVPEKLVADVGGYFTLLPLYQSPSDLAKPRFYGINARLGYLIPVKSVTLGVHAGWYFWGMLVPNSAYGVSFAQGPQLLLSVRSNSKRTNFAYIKFAPLDGGFFSNREIAIGGQIALGPKLWQRPLGLSLDIASFTYETSDQANSVNLATITLGFSLPLTKP
jgi:hypothetical protein